MKRKLMLLDTFEQALVLRDRERRANLKAVSDMLAVGKARITARFEAPPVGGPYHCKECGCGTHADDHVCAACWAY